MYNQLEYWVLQHSMKDSWMDGWIHDNRQTDRQTVTGLAAQAPVGLASPGSGQEEEHWARSPFRPSHWSVPSLTLQQPLACNASPVPHAMGTRHPLELELFSRRREGIIRSPRGVVLEIK